MTTLIRRFMNDDSGATAIEYALILAMIFLVIVSAVGLFATRATGMFGKISTAVGNVTG